MAGIIFSEASGVNKSVYGMCQAPIQMFIESYDTELQSNSMLPKLFKMYDSQNFADYMGEMTPMSGPQPVGENGAYPKDNMQEGFGKMVQYDTWKDSFSISEDMMEDDKVLDLTSAPQTFMDAWHLTRESFGAAIFGGALKQQKTMKFRGREVDISSADGQSVFHIAHAPKTKGSKQASLKRKVFAAIGSDIDPVMSTHAFNYQYGRWTVIIWPFLNQFIGKGSEPWMLMDSKFNQRYGGAVWAIV